MKCVKAIRKPVIYLVSLLCILALAGCKGSGGAGSSAGGNPGNSPAADQNGQTPFAAGGDSAAGDASATAKNPGNGENDGSGLIASSDLRGTVIEFSDSGCVLSPTTLSDDGLSAVEAAEGYEDSGEKVTVTYEEGCIFQHAVISITTGKAVLSDISVSDIKKKSALLLFGNFEDTDHFTACRVITVRYEEE